ncbi:hypothetical protein [Phytohabitans rumicis]|uniref:Uncharacterized protein n=1 Tax=Phytohabitans rumicis TaxID=1076125 RepID=A0A6V8LM02_9ACTN|nr:hypothetical protein [Phytohabitans rumicis]GFJ96031.1 hypothetical protein Prum_096730 [Phytohabitans rumicis]
MTDQRTSEQWTRPTRTMELADPDRTEPESSTQDSTAPDLTVTERFAEDGAVYHSATHDEVVPERTFAEPDAQSAADDPEADVPAAEHAVDGSVAADHADLDHAEPGDDSQAAQEQDGVAVAAGPGGPVDDINDVSGSGDLLPGDVPTGTVALFDGATADRFRDRWQQLQLRFIDDPHTAAAQAGALADEVVTALRDAVDQHRTGLEDWQSDNGSDAHFGDTERLRVAVRHYRDFVDRLLAM